MLTSLIYLFNVITCIFTIFTNFEFNFLNLYVILIFKIAPFYNKYNSNCNIKKIYFTFRKFK